jgi:hypothetical protein
VRSIIILRKRGCRLWLLAAFWGTLLQIALSPVRWPNNAAYESVQRVGLEGKRSEIPIPHA